MTENDYVIEVHDGVGAVEAGEWDALLAAQAHPTPFMRHAYLRALEASDSVGGDTGWQPVTLTLRQRQGGALVAAAAAYLKMHSYGEYGMLCRMTLGVQIRWGFACQTWKPNLQGTSRLLITSGHEQM